MKEREFVTTLTELATVICEQTRNQIIVSLGKADVDFLGARLSRVLCICDSAIIRDYFDVWIGSNYSLYSIVFDSLLLLSFSATSQDEIVSLAAQTMFIQCLKIWSYLCSLEEFSNATALASISTVENPSEYKLTYCATSLTKLVSVMLIYYSWMQTCEFSKIPLFTCLQVISNIKALLHWLYVHLKNFRAQWRLCIGNLLRATPLSLLIPDDQKALTPANIAIQLRLGIPSIQNLIPVPTKSTTSTTKVSEPVPDRKKIELYSHVKHLLDVLFSVLEGMQQNREKCSARQTLLQRVLLPLHRPNEMVLWRDQVPVLQDYHEALVRCTVKAAGISSALLEFTIVGLLSLWPESFNTNTPKQVLLLHELETILLIYLSVPAVKKDTKMSLVWTPFWTRFAQCVGTDSDNIRPAQRALQFFKNEDFLRIFDCQETEYTGDNAAKMELFHESMRQVLPALYRNGSLSWNPTVNKMTGMALMNIKKMTGEEQFKLCCLKYLAQYQHRLPNEVRHSSTRPTASLPISLPKLPPTQPLPRPHLQQLKPSARQVPSARMPEGGFTPMSMSSHQPGSYSRSNPPPLELTGVAPWALMPAPASSSTKICSIDESGYDRMLTFIEQCLPDAEAAMSAEIDSKMSEWSVSQANVTPTLLPELKFHDLVFGHSLGEGSFSTVKYARHITKDCSQSLWPEYAVKVMNASKIAELHYRDSCIREMACLQLFSHPNIARLVSCFQYNESAYLVLEYASRGDLHSLVMAAGKFNHYQTRFAVGEVVAALLYIHEMGFSYNDLKPENLLVTALGHIKLTDFGACRAVSKKGRSHLSASTQRLVHIRSGDWKDTGDLAKDFNSVVTAKRGREGDDDDLWSTKSLEAVEGDLRVECTPAYSPPELLLRKAAADRGGPQSSSLLVEIRLPRTEEELQRQQLAADAWGVGCVAYFCLKARPLFYGDLHMVLRQIEDLHTENQNQFTTATQPGKKITFSEVHTLSVDVDAGVDSVTSGGVSVASELNQAAERFLRSLITIDPFTRSGVFAASEHEYLRFGTSHALTSSSIVELNPVALHRMLTPPAECCLPLQKGGSTAECEQAGWQRRQFSVLWAPMPHEYQLDGHSQMTAGGAPSIAGETDPKTTVHLDRWLASHPYRLVSIAESDEERGSLFYADI